MDNEQAPGQYITATIDATRPASGLSIHRQRDESMAQAFTGLIPSSIGEALALSQSLSRAGDAVPKVYRGNPEAAFVVIMAGMEIGMTPLRSLNGFVPIGGGLAMKADLQLAIVRRSGALAFFDEGFELANETDGNLAERVTRTGRDEDERGALSQLAETILDLSASVPEGKPYGWAISQRRGDHQKHVRVFTFNDAENFKTTAWEDNRKVEGKLSERSAYKNNPQDMYPKRARVRVLAVTHSDVLMGMPAVEAMDGVEEDQPGAGARTPTPTSNEDTIQAVMAEIGKADAATGKAIQDGFGLMEMGPARRLQLLRKYDGKPKELAEFLRDEYANRKNGGKGRAIKPDQDEGQKADPRPAQGGDPKTTEQAAAGESEAAQASTEGKRARRRF